MAKSYKLNVYQGTNKQWYWRLVAANGKTVAVGGEGYKRRGTMLVTLAKLFPEGPLRAQIDAAKAQIKPKVPR